MLALSGTQPETASTYPETAPADDPCWAVPWLADLLPVPEDATWPRHMTLPHPRAVGSLGAEFSAWATARSGKPLRWWQRLVATRLLETDEDGRLVWEALVLTLARQLGKSWLLRELFLWRLHQAERFGEPQLVLHTGKDIAICREVQRSARRWAREQGGFVVREANGTEEICLTETDSRWLIRARDSVYGYSASLGAVDEGWKVAAAIVDEGLEPTMTERSQPQLLLVSTAHRRATSLMLNRRQAAAQELDDPAVTLMLEWSAPRDADIEAVTTWREASPHWSDRRERLIGARLDSALAGELGDPDEPDPIEAFRAQWLNQWPTRSPLPKRLADEPLLPAGAWRNAAGDATPAGPLVLALEDWYGQGAAAAAVATHGDRFVVGGWCFACWADAVAWASGWCSLHPGSRVLVAASMADDPVAKDLPATLQTVGRAQTPSALSKLRDLVAAGRVIHDGSPDMAEQVDEARVVQLTTGLRLGQERSDLLRCVAWALQAAEHRRAAKRVAIS